MKDRTEKTFAILRQLDDHAISMPQARAQLKDLGYGEWAIDLYIDGDVTVADDDASLASAQSRDNA